MSSAQAKGQGSAPEPVRSPERQKLADAIAHVAATRAKRDEVLAATRMAESMVSAALRDLTAAQEAIEAAKLALRDTIHAAALRGVMAPTDTALREARLAEAEAQDRLVAAKEALAAIAAPLSDWEARLRERTDYIDSARAAVAAGSVSAMMDSLVPAKREIARAALVLRVLSDSSSRRTYDPAVTEQLQRAGTVWSLIANLPLFADAVAAARTDDATVSQWVNALDRLRIDADTPLPGAPIPIGDASVPRPNAA